MLMALSILLATIESDSVWHCSDRVDGILAIQSTRELLSDSFSDRLTEITRTYGYSLFPEIDD
jgi:hypothetical protein